MCAVENSAEKRGNFVHLKEKGCEQKIARKPRPTGRTACSTTRISVYKFDHNKMKIIPKKNAPKQITSICKYYIENLV